MSLKVSSMNAFILCVTAIASALLAPERSQSAPKKSVPDDSVDLFSIPVPQKPKVVFADFYLETESKPKGWAERFGDAVRNPRNAKIAGDVIEKFGFPREAADGTWRWYGEMANQIVPSEISNNGETENGFFRSPPGYTFCNAELLDEPDIHQMKDHHVTYLGVARRVRNPDGLTSDDGLAYSITVPRVANESTWVKSHIRLKYVEADRGLVLRFTEEGKCVAHNTCVWLYSDGNPRRTNVFTCEPKDVRRDRWAPDSFEQLIRAISK